MRVVRNWSGLSREFQMFVGIVLGQAGWCCEQPGAVEDVH